MTAGLAWAAAAAVAYGVASVLQSVAASRTPATGRLDARGLAGVIAQLPYVIGLALDLVGFVFSVVALHTLPLFLVQSLIAGSVGVTAVVAVLFLRARLRVAEVVALSAVVLGLVLLAVAAQPGHARALSRVGEWALLASVAALAAGAAGAVRLPRATAAVALAAIAGAAFGGVGIAARSLAFPHPLWRVVAVPSAWALAAFGVIGTLVFASALQRGTVTAVSAVMFAVETVVPSFVGLAVLGDATRPGTGPALALAGVVLTLGGAIGLAPYAEPASLPEVS